MSPPVPYTPKPSILDRILGRLIPTDQYGGLLGPVDRRSIQKQGLLQLGAGILSQTGPESGLPAVGRAIQGLDVPGMAEHALRLKSYQQEMAQHAQRQQIGQQLATGGGDLGETIRRIMPLYVDDPETMKALGEVLRTLPPPTKYEQGTTATGAKVTFDPTTGTYGPEQIPGKPAEDKIPPTQVLSTAQARLAKWEPMNQAIGQYQQFRNSPPSPASDSALLAASQALTGVHGGYPDESPELGKAGEIGHLLRLLQALGGSQALTDKQRADLIQTTDAVVSRIRSEMGRTRADVERQLRGAKFSDAEIQQYLPTPPGGKVGNLLDGF